MYGIRYWAHLASFLEHRCSSLIVLSFVFSVRLSAQAQSDKNEVLIFGTSHLEQTDGFETHMLEDVLQKLDSFNFDVIGIEKMSGQLLNDISSRKDSAFDGIIKNGFGAQFLKIADTVQFEKRITFLKANINIKTILEKKNITDKNRKDLIFNLLAVTDLPSAVLQFSYIKDKTLFKSSFEKYIADLLESKVLSRNEYYSLAVRLAKKEQINQLEPIDNFQDESLLFKYYPDFFTDFQANSELLKGIKKLPIFKQITQHIERSIASANFSDLYIFLNSAEFKNADYEAQWKIWLKTKFPSGSDRARFYLWEMRNLQIVANILDVISRHPYKRILIIIGASHTGFLEKYLRQIDSIRILNYE